MRAISLMALALTLAVATAVRAQSFAVDRGSWRVGGTAGASKTSYDGKAHTTALALSPSAQYFVLAGLAVGASVTAGRYTGPFSHTLQYGAGPDATYYFGRGSRPVYPYVGGSAFLVDTRFTDESLSPATTTTTTSTEYEPYAGIVVMLARNAGVDARVYYRRHEEGSREMSSYGLALGVSAFLF